MSNLITIYDIYSTIKALGKKVSVAHADPIGDEARTFILSGDRSDVLKVGATLIALTGTFEPTTRANCNSSYLAPGRLHLTVTLGSGYTGLIREPEPDRADLTNALFQIACRRIPGDDQRHDALGFSLNGDDAASMVTDARQALNLPCCPVSVVAGAVTLPHRKTRSKSK